MNGALFRQALTAYAGYSETVEAVTESTADRPILVDKTTFSAELSAWLEERSGLLVESHSLADSYTVIGVPNVVLDPGAVLSALRRFGDSQPYGTYAHLPLFEQYSGGQLCGTNPHNGRPIQFSVIPRAVTHHVQGTVDEQRALLAEVRESQPHLQVPSVLEAVTYWNTLRAKGGAVSGPDAFGQTVIRHFDLPKKLMDTDYCIPRSYVDFFGEPFVLRSNASSRFGARLSIR